MKKERGEALISSATGLFRADGGVRGLSYARAPRSNRRRGGIGIAVRNEDGTWLRTQLSVEHRDFYEVFAHASRLVAEHGGLAFDERALRSRLKASANIFLQHYRLRAVRVCYYQALEIDPSQRADRTERGDQHRSAV